MKENQHAHVKRFKPLAMRAFSIRHQSGMTFNWELGGSLAAVQARKGLGGEVCMRRVAVGAGRIPEYAELQRFPGKKYVFPRQEPIRESGKAHIAASPLINFCHWRMRFSSISQAPGSHVDATERMSSWGRPALPSAG